MPTRRNRTIRTSRSTTRNTARGTNRSSRGRGRSRGRRGTRLPLLLLLVFVVVTAGATSFRDLGGDGSLAYAAGRIMAFLDFMAGVFTLLALTATVVFGLAATDRLVLTPRRRVAMQSAHRAAAVASLGFLVIHVAVKVYDQEATPLAALVPFAGGANLAVGIGVVAADLMVFVALTGALRGRFAGSGRPWLWRAMHGTAYASWPIALAHGLTAGREAKEWVLWGYGLCVAAVALALMVRLLAALGNGSAARRARRLLQAYGPELAPGAVHHAPAEEEQLLLATHGTLGSSDAPAGASSSSTAETAAHRRPEPEFARMYGTGPEFAASASPDTPDYVSVPENWTSYPPQHVQQVQQVQPPQQVQPQYAYAYSQPQAQPQPQPAPAPWPGEYDARPHPALAETPPHGFAVPVFPQPPQYVPDWVVDSSSWAALSWDTPPQGVPLFDPACAYAPSPAPVPDPGQQQGRGW